MDITLVKLIFIVYTQEILVCDPIDFFIYDTLIFFFFSFFRRMFNNEPAYAAVFFMMLTVSRSYSQCFPKTYIT